MSHEAELMESITQLVGSKRRQEGRKKVEKKPKGFVLTTSASKETDSKMVNGKYEPVYSVQIKVTALKNAKSSQL